MVGVPQPCTTLSNHMRKSTTASGPRKVERVREPTQLVDMLSKLLTRLVVVYQWFAIATLRRWTFQDPRLGFL
jgi:hypothetical protein